MTWNAGEDSAFSFLPHPNERPVFAIHFRGCEHMRAGGITNERPIRFIQKVNGFRKTARDRVLAIDEPQREGHVPVIRAAGLGAQPNSFRQLLGILVSDHRGVNQRYSAAAFQERVQLVKTGGRPMVIPKIEDHDVR